MSPERSNRFCCERNRDLHHYHPKPANWGKDVQNHHYVVLPRLELAKLDPIKEMDPTDVKISAHNPLTYAVSSSPKNIL